MKALAFLTLIISASFGAAENVALFVGDSVGNAFFENYLPFLIQSLTSGPFADIEFPAAGMKIRLQGLTIQKLEANPSDFIFETKDGIINIEIRNFETRVISGFKIIDGLGVAGKVNVSSKGGNLLVTLKMERDKTNRFTVKTNSCSANLVNFRNSFIGNVGAEIVDIITEIFGKSKIKEGAEYGVCTAITSFFDSTLNDLVQNLPQEVSLGQEFGFSLNLAPSEDVIGLGGFLYRTDGAIFDTQTNLSEMPKLLSVSPNPSSQKKLERGDRMVSLSLHEFFFKKAIKSIFEKRSSRVFIEQKDTFQLSVSYGYALQVFPIPDFSLPSVQQVAAEIQTFSVPNFRILGGIFIVDLPLNITFEGLIFNKKVSFSHLLVSVKVRLQPQLDDAYTIILKIKEFDMQRLKVDPTNKKFPIANDELSTVITNLVNAYFESSDLELKIPLKDIMPSDVILQNPVLEFDHRSLILRTDLHFDFKRPFGAQPTDAKEPLKKNDNGLALI